MSARDDAVRALDDRDWSGAEVDTQRRQVSLVFSTRLPADLAEALLTEAEARGMKPGVLIRELVELGLSARDEETVTVGVSALRQEIDQAIRRAQRFEKAA